MDSDLGSQKKHLKVLTVWYPGLEMVHSRQGAESKTAANTRTLHLFKQGMLWKFNIYIENTAFYLACVRKYSLVNTLCIVWLPTWSNLPCIGK